MKKMRYVLSFIMTCAMCISQIPTSFAIDEIPENTFSIEESISFEQEIEVGSYDDETGLMFDPAPDINEITLDATPRSVRVEPRGLLASITVTVCSPCDEEFRSQFPGTWMSAADSRIEQADNTLFNWFGIDYYSQRQETWSSPNNLTYYADIYNDAINKYGRSMSADVMIGFSGQDAGVGGCANILNRYAMCWEYGFTYTANTVAHESGHMYGCYDSCGGICLMSGYPGQICNNCFNTWNGNKYRY